MPSPSSPNSFISSKAGPECPNTSFTPILVTFVGHFALNASHTALPKPPITECSSTVNTFLVFSADFTIISSSKGLIV